MFKIFQRKKDSEKNQEPVIPSLLILGGTGRVGSEIIRQALTRGYKVRAITRDLSKARQFEEGQVEWQQCDATNKECMKKAAEGRTAIISSIYPETRDNPNLFANSLRAIVDAMKANKVNRFITVTCDWDSPLQTWYFRNIARRLYRKVRVDMIRMENMLEMRPKDEIKWTIVRTFRIIEQSKSGKYRVGKGDLDPPFEPVSYTGDIADFVLNELQQTNWNRQFVTLGL